MVWLGSVEVGPCEGLAGEATSRPHASHKRTDASPLLLQVAGGSEGNSEAESKKQPAADGGQSQPQPRNPRSCCSVERCGDCLPVLPNHIPQMVRTPD